MSNKLPISSETITQPIVLAVDNPAVEGIYALPDSSPEVADMASHVAFTKYAASRFEPRFEGSDEMIIEVDVEKPARRIVREEGYVLDVTPRLSLAVLALTTVVANVSGNLTSLTADATEIAAQLHYNAKQNVSSWLGHDTRPREVTFDTATPGGRIIISHEYAQPAGQSIPDKAVVGNFVDELAQMQQKGGTVGKITVVAGSSDEHGPFESTLTVPNAGNDALDDTRGADAKNELEAQAEAAGVKLSEIEVISAENLLTAGEVDELRSKAAQYNLSVDEVLATYKSDGTLPEPLQKIMKEKIGDARSVSLRAEAQEPAQITTETLNLGEQPPKDEKHPYRFFPQLPLPFMRRRRIEKYMKPGTEEVKIPAAGPDERWIELYPEAAQTDGTLPRDAWRFTRKYQLLAREDRIPYTLTHRYKDVDGVEQEMRVLFIDHEPTDDAIAMYTELLNDASQMNGGKLPERWSALSVFPRSQVGLNPTGGRRGQNPAHHPADIGLDIDQQASSGVLGLAIPAMGLIEMHMPEFSVDVQTLKPRDGQTIEQAYQEAYDRSRSEYMQALRGYMKANWVTAHELVGHGTDVDNIPIHLIQAHPRNFTHFYTSSNWHNTAAAQFEQLPDSDAEGLRDFDATWQMRTPSGQIVTRDEKVYQDGQPKLGPVKRFMMRLMGLDPDTHIQASVDPRLRASHTAVLNGRKPTIYSGENHLELHAEVGAQAQTGELIPYKETGLKVAPYHTELARGYSVDPGLKHNFEERTGWSRETSRPVNPDEFTLSLAEDDPVIGAWMDKARNTPMPNNRITLLAHVTSVKDPNAK